MFYLGTHIPAHFARSTVPLFVSRTRLERQKKWPRAQGPWSLDSGGFTEVALRGGWNLSPTSYAQMARRYRDEIGNLRWAAPQDWMCEPIALKATGLSIAEHQRRTIENYLDLVSYAPDVPWIPVLQGWEKDDYRKHVDTQLPACRWTWSPSSASVRSVDDKATKKPARFCTRYAMPAFPDCTALGSRFSAYARGDIY